MYGTHCSHSLRRAFPARSGTKLIRELDLDLTLWNRTAGVLAPQCRWDEAVHLYCPWSSPVCSDELKRATLDIEAEAKAALAETTRIRPLPRLWLSTQQRQQFRAAGMTVGARRNSSRRQQRAAMVRTHTDIDSHTSA